MHCSQHKTADMNRSANGSEKFGSNCPCEDKKRATPKPPEALALAQEYVDFLNACKSPWHVVARVKSMLMAAGFSEVSMETGNWNLAPGRKHFVIKGGSTILAFALGGRWTPSSRIAFAAPHSDSPALRIKPNSNRGGLGYIQVGCGLYGGGFWHTWFDRDLGIAGRVFVQSGNRLEGRLLRIDKAIANVPSLAIHFDSSMNTNLMINFETQLLPIIGLGDPKEDPTALHQPMLMDLLATELNVQKEQIVEFDLNLYDINPATIGGVNNDFVFGQFQDNQYCSFVALKALLDAINQPGFSSAPHAYIYATYDHEEVGNKSDVGASSDWSKRVLIKICGRDNFAGVVDKSCAFSADVDHGVHPNYSDYYEVNSRPDLDGGPIIKYNYSLEMATTANSAAIAREVGRRADIQMQGTIPKNSKRTGSTHGPSLSAKLGIPTCDLGPPLLAMHSIRETSAVMGVWNLKKYFECFYQEFNDIMDNFVESVRGPRALKNPQIPMIMGGSLCNDKESNDTTSHCCSVCNSNKNIISRRSLYSPLTIVDQNGNTYTEDSYTMPVNENVTGEIRNGCVHSNYIRNDMNARCTNTPCQGMQNHNMCLNCMRNDVDNRHHHMTSANIPNHMPNNNLYANIMRRDINMMKCHDMAREIQSCPMCSNMTDNNVSIMRHRELINANSPSQMGYTNTFPINTENDMQAMMKGLYVNEQNEDVSRDESQMKADSDRLYNQ